MAEPVPESVREHCPQHAQQLCQDSMAAFEDQTHSSQSSKLPKAEGGGSLDATALGAGEQRAFALRTKT